MSKFHRSSLFVLLTAPLAHATLSHDEPVPLEHLVVSASPYARSQTDLAQPTTVVAGRELFLNPASSLGDLLAGQPGVSSTSFGPGASRPVIRGLGGDRIRLLTGGVGTFDASVISPDHAVSIDPLLIERVEIIRGPATLLYGGNAVGGAVNAIDHRIHTARPDQPLHVRAEARASSVNDEESGGIVLEGGADSIAWHLDAYRRQAGDLEIPGFAQTARRRATALAEALEHGDDPPAEIHGHIPNTALTADGAAAGLSFFGDHTFLGFAFSGHNTLYGIPAAAHAHESFDESDTHPHAHGHDHEGVRIDLRQRRFDLQASLTPSSGFVREVRLKLGLARYRHAELEDDQIATVFRNRSHDARLELLHQPLGVFSGAFGWHTTQSDFSALGEEAFLPPSRTRTHALFLLEETETKPVSWQLGARVERHTIDLRDNSPRSSAENTVSVSTGAVWTLDETWTLSASLAHGERAPNTQERFADGFHAGTGVHEIGDPDLRPERSLAFDLTLRKRAGWITGSATAFAHHFDGFIHLNAEPSASDVYHFSQHDARFHGAELEAIFHLLHADHHQLDFTVAADFVRATNTATHTPLPRITPARLKPGIVWRRGPLVLGADAHFVGRPHRLAPEETSTSSYLLANAYATYRFSFERTIVDVFLRVSNFTNTEARLHTSFLKDVAPLSARNVTVGLRLTF